MLDIFSKCGSILRCGSRMITPHLSIGVCWPFMPSVQAPGVAGPLALVLVLLQSNSILSHYRGGRNAMTLCCKVRQVWHQLALLLIFRILSQSTCGRRAWALTHLYIKNRGDHCATCKI